MAANIEAEQALRFEIEPRTDESERACAAIVEAGLPRSFGTLILIGLYAAVVAVAYWLTPATWGQTAVIGVGAVVATTLALQLEGRRRVRQARSIDPHSLETYWIEVTSEGVRNWCAHVDARYAWGDFPKVMENREFYIFVRGSGTGVAIPKRLLTPESEVALRKRIRDHSPDGGAMLVREAAGGANRPSN